MAPAAPKQKPRPIPLLPARKNPAAHNVIAHSHQLSVKHWRPSECLTNRHHVIAELMKYNSFRQINQNNRVHDSTIACNDSAGTTGAVLE